MSKGILPTVEEWEAAQREIARLNERITKLTMECNQRDASLTSEIDRADLAEQELEKYRTRYLAISGLVSERHGDDDRFAEPEDEMGDDPDTITIKRIFKILDQDEADGFEDSVESIFEEAGDE